MKPRHFFLSTVTLVVVAIGTNCILWGEEVVHHGFEVNSAARYYECLFCHDGSIAQNINPCIGVRCFFSDSHPVERNYPPPTKGRYFHPTGVAEQHGVIFVDGKIDCISCHNLLNADKYHLRVDQRQSRLCFACHIK